MAKSSPFLAALAATVVLTMSALNAQPQALPKSIQKGTTVEGITSYQLDNGLLVLLMPDNSKPTVTVNVTYKVGSKNENYGETGMAHLLEHMVYKGTPTSGNIMQSLSAHGAGDSFNGTTSDDRTNYYEVLPSSDENLKWALSMEADRMVNSKIAKSDLDTEMTVVRNEYEGGENSPAQVLMKRVLAAAYQWHNYGKTTIGNRSDIENVPIERLQAFYHKYYQPDNAMLVVAGKFDTAKTLGWIGEFFVPIPKPTRVLEKLYTKEPVQDGEKLVTVRRVGDEQWLITLYHTPSGTHPDNAPLNLLAQILGDSPSGRLYKGLVDNKKAAMVFAGQDDKADAGHIMFGARLKKDQPIKEVQDFMINAVENFAKEPPTKEEFERAKTKMLTDLDLTMSNTERVGVLLSEFQAQGDWRMIYIFRDRIKNTKLEDVTRVAKAYLKDSNRTMGMFIPTGKPDRSEITDAPDIATVLKEYKGEAAKSEGEVFDPSPENIDKRTLKATLPNGMHLVMLPKKTKGNIVQGSLVLRYGTEKSQFGRTTIASMTGGLLMKGTTSRTRQQIDDEISKLNAQLGVGGGVSAVSANLQTIGPNLGALLKLAADVLRHPLFPDTELDSMKQRNLTQIEAGRSDPQSVAGLEFARSTRNYPRGDVRAVKSIDESIADVKAVTLADVKKFHTEFYGASYGTLTLVGDFDPQEVQKLAKDLFSDWKSPSTYEHVPHMYAPAKVVNKSLETPDKENAMFLAGMPIKLTDEDPDFPAVQLASFLFGGGTNSRVFTRLRQKEGWSYGAGAGINAGTKKDTDGGMFGYAILAPQNMTKLEAGFKDELNKALTAGFTPEEVETGKKALLQQAVLARSEDRGLMQILSSNDFLGRTMTGYQAAIEKQVASLTPDQVSGAFRKYVKPDDLIVVKAGDFKKAASTPAAAPQPPAK